MTTTVKKAVLWRAEIENKVGALAATLEPLAKEGADLRAGMGYRFPGDKTKAAIELFPVTGQKRTAAAQAAGLGASAIPTLLVEGDNTAGLGHTIALALAAAGVNMDFLVAQVIGRKYSAVFGFETEDDAKKASAIIKKAVKRKAK